MSLIYRQHNILRGYMMKYKLLFTGLLVLTIISLTAQMRLNLPEARSLALKHNQQIQISNEQSAIANDLKKAAFTYFLPSVSALGDFTYMNKKIKYEKELGLDRLLAGLAQANPAVQTDPLYQTLVGLMQQGMLPNELSLELGQHHNYLAALSLNQPLFTGGKILSQYKLARLNTDLSKASLQLKQNEIIFKTDEAYWRIVTLKEKVRLAEQYKAMVQMHVNDMQNLLDAGMVTSNEYLKVQVALNEAELQLLKAENGVALAVMAFNQITGLSPDEVINLADTTLVINDTISALPSMQEVLSQRQEITALKTGIKMSETAEHLSLSRYMPNILLNAQYGVMNPNPYNSFENEYGDDWQVNVMAQWDIFHWNERGYETAAARHSTKIAQLKLNEAEEMINLEVHQAWYKYKEAITKIKLTEVNLQQSAENLRQVQDKFADSMASSSDVLDAQTLWQKAYSENIDAKADYHVISTNLQKACGNLNMEESCF